MTGHRTTPNAVSAIPRSLRASRWTAAAGRLGTRGSIQRVVAAPLLHKISQLQREIGQFHEAVVSHAVVDQAIGVVVALGGLRPDQGFEALREISQHTHVKLRLISEMIVD